MFNVHLILNENMVNTNLLQTCGLKLLNIVSFNRSGMVCIYVIHVAGLLECIAATCAVKTAQPRKRPLHPALIMGASVRYHKVTVTGNET